MPFGQSRSFTYLVSKSMGWSWETYWWYFHTFLHTPSLILKHASHIFHTLWLFWLFSFKYLWCLKECTIDGRHICINFIHFFTHSFTHFSHTLHTLFTHFGLFYQFSANFNMLGVQRRNTGWEFHWWNFYTLSKLLHALTHSYTLFTHSSRTYCYSGMFWLFFFILILCMSSQT